MIKTMIARLEQEAAKEASHAQWCSKEMEENKTDLEDLAGKVKKTTARLDTISGKIDEEGGRMTEVTENLNKLTKSLQEMTENRNAEKEANEKVLAEDKEAGV